MTREQLKALCELLMVSDPWPISEEAKNQLTEYADRISRQMGFTDWIDALHQL